MRRSLSTTFAVLLAAAGAQAADATSRAAPDTLAQRVAACTSCHGSADAAPGADAAASGERRYFPRIAGKPADYLLNQMHNFRDGRRQYPLMTWMVTPLSEDYMREIAGWFAGQHLPAVVLDRASLPPGDIERGRKLVMQGDAAAKVPACVACHGQRLTGALPAIPGLLGLPRDYINAQFGAWRNGTRRALAPADVVAVSAWLASEPLPADPTPAASVARPLPLACGSAPEAAR